ncbi:MAG TPA: hypothetical protein VH619_06660 [Verrucomicrobiae bacterium]|jgi:hypothetical protein|nr:hypothetical protein [Verrucomicrobiae bacterium]
MTLGYRFYRHSFIKLAILSVPVAIVLLEHLRGKGNPKDETGALVLLAFMMVIGNLGLFIAMRRAKRREEAARVQAASDFSGGLREVNQDARVMVFEVALRKRKKSRLFMECWAIGGGVLVAVFGRSYLVEGMPAAWVGYFLMLIGILGLCGVNVFYGGPLDMRLDRAEDR